MREEYSILSGLKKGRDLPDWFLEQPQVLRGEEFYIQAFWDLTSERAIGQGMLGRIPWSKAIEYALRNDVEPDMLDAFWRIIYGMDSGYLEQQRDEYSKAAASQKAALRNKSKKRYDR